MPQHFGEKKSTDSQKPSPWTLWILTGSERREWEEMGQSGWKLDSSIQGLGLRVFVTMRGKSPDVHFWSFSNRPDSVLSPVWHYHHSCKLTRPLPSPHFSDIRLRLRKGSVSVCRRNSPGSLTCRAETHRSKQFTLREKSTPYWQRANVFSPYWEKNKF